MNLFFTSWRFFHYILIRKYQLLVLADKSKQINECVVEVGEKGLIAKLRQKFYLLNMFKFLLIYWK